MCNFVAIKSPVIVEQTFFTKYVIFTEFPPKKTKKTPKNQQVCNLYTIPPLKKKKINKFKKYKIYI